MGGWRNPTSGASPCGELGAGGLGLQARAPTTTPPPGAPRPPAASIRASPHLPPAPARAPPPPARTPPAAPPPPARPPRALPGSLPVSLKCHRGAPGIAASKSRPTTQQRGHRSGAARARREPAPPGRLSRAREARPHPARRCAGPAPGPAGARGARAGGEDAAAAGRTARSARPAPPRALPAPAPCAPEPGPAARALLRDRCRPSGRQGKRAARTRRGEAGGWVGARPGDRVPAQHQRLARGGVSSSLWRPGRWREGGGVML